MTKRLLLLLLSLGFFGVVYAQEDTGSTDSAEVLTEDDEDEAEPEEVETWSP